MEVPRWRPRQSQSRSLGLHTQCNAFVGPSLPITETLRGVHGAAGKLTSLRRKARRVHVSTVSSLERVNRVAPRPSTNRSPTFTQIHGATQHPRCPVPALAEAWCQAAQLRLRSVPALPLIGVGGFIGAMNVNPRPQRPFDERAAKIRWDLRRSGRGLGAERPGYSPEPNTSPPSCSRG